MPWRRTGFVPADTSAGFWQGDDYGDLENEVYLPLLLAWLLAAVVAGALVLRLTPLARRMAERQRPMIAALRERGAGRRRILAVLAMQVLALVGGAFLTGGAAHGAGSPSHRPQAGTGTRTAGE